MGGGGEGTRLPWLLPCFWSLSNDCRSLFPRVWLYMRNCCHIMKPGGGRRYLKKIDGPVLLPAWRHVSRQWFSKWRAKCSSKRLKNFEFITEILFRFLGFGDITVPIVIEIQTLVLFWNETSNDVIILKIPFYRPANFPNIHIDRSHF